MDKTIHPPQRRHTINAHPVENREQNRNSNMLFLGRVGGNQQFTYEREYGTDPRAQIHPPDASPGMTLKEQLDLRPFRDLGLWKAGLAEGIGTMLLVFLTGWAGISPNVLPTPPTDQLGYFDNAAYLGPLTGGFSNFLLLSLFIFAFGVVSGAHLNPTITLATFGARLATLPRTVLYVSFQLVGATLGGLLVRAGYGTRDFKIGGCWMFEDLVPVQDALAIEFVAAAALLFLAFGVGLDPRQHKVIPPSLAPFLVGLSLGAISWMTGYSRYGYGGASLNPARCFGVYAGSYFPSWHWHHWVGDIAAIVLHSMMYWVSPPGVSPSTYS